MPPTLWQGQLAESFTVGTGTPYRWSRDRLAMVGLPAPRTYDQDRGDHPGSVAGIDLPARRIMPLPFEIATSGSQAAALEDLADLKRAWAPRSTDTTLDLYFPGQPSSDGILRFYGRPRGITADLGRISGGWVRALAIFDALDPFGYGPEVAESTDASSPTSVTSDGDVETDRFTITVVGNGGIPSVTSATDDGSTVALAGTLAAAAEAVFDFRTHTVEVAGTEVEVAAGPRWFRLLPGVNSITFTGCASVQVTHRPAYL